MADWATISSLATAGGTLVLAVATFASVRSANRAARVAERAYLVGLRPVLFPSHLDDSMQKIRWGDDHWAALQGGRGVVELADDVVYMAISLRNVASGIAVIHGWRAAPLASSITPLVRPEPDTFTLQGRDLYVPPNEPSFWQAAYRDQDPDGKRAAVAAIEARTPMMVDLLYGDHEGGQRAISRFTLTPPSSGDGQWLASVVRHWNLDRDDPR